MSSEGSVSQLHS